MEKLSGGIIDKFLISPTIDFYINHSLIIMKILLNDPFDFTAESIKSGTKSWVKNDLFMIYIRKYNLSIRYEGSFMESLQNDNFHYEEYVNGCRQGLSVLMSDSCYTSIKWCNEDIEMVDFDNYFHLLHRGNKYILMDAFNKMSGYTINIKNGDFHLFQYGEEIPFIANTHKPKEYNYKHVVLRDYCWLYLEK